MQYRWTKLYHKKVKRNKWLIEATPTTLTSGKPPGTKNKQNLWKNMEAPLWKPPAE
jgi:hypothetical protein